MDDSLPVLMGMVTFALCLDVAFGGRGVVVASLLVVVLFLFVVVKIL